MATLNPLRAAHVDVTGSRTFHGPSSAWTNSLRTFEPDTDMAPSSFTVLWTTASLAHHLWMHLAFTSDSHTTQEIYAARLSPGFESLVARRLTAGDSEQGTASGVAIDVCCPICNVLSPGLEQFRHHLLASHILYDPVYGLGHFHAWKNLLEQIVQGTDDHSRVTALQPWTRLDKLDLSPELIMQCPSCFFFVDDGHNDLITADMNTIHGHHLALLRSRDVAAAELYPHRMQILRLFPEFVSHPVFDDLETV